MKLAIKIRQAVEKEINGRRGIGWDHMPPEIKREIRQALNHVIDKTINEYQEK